MGCLYDRPWWEGFVGGVYDRGILGFAMGGFLLLVACEMVACEIRWGTFHLIILIACCFYRFIIP